jgi:hypothetical protein
MPEPIRPDGVPEHLPARLSISLWDFSWFTRAAPGDVFADLDGAVADAIDRGYNTLRICAMPLRLFGLDMDTAAMRFTPFGGDYGQRVRWYDVRGSATFDGRARLLELFAAAARHDVRIILSSWEYQQTPSFAENRGYFDAIMAIEPAQRPLALAQAMSDLVDFVTEAGFRDRIAFVEIHNEVQFTRLTQALPAGVEAMTGLCPLLDHAIDAVRKRHPDLLVTANYARVPVETFRAFPPAATVAVFHPYIYGVLDELMAHVGVGRDAPSFRQDVADVELLRPGSPRREEWLPPEPDRWRLEATICEQTLFYLHDWCDPQLWDRWLYSHYGQWRHEMTTKLRTWIESAADLAAGRGIPLVFGEGYVGYTPLQTRFEEDGVGVDVLEQAMRASIEVGAWGAVVCSNAAPQHPMWADVAMQQRLNAALLSGDTTRLGDRAARLARGIR